MGLNHRGLLTILSALHRPRGRRSGRTDHHKGTRRFLSDDPNAAPRPISMHQKSPSLEMITLNQYPLLVVHCGGCGFTAESYQDSRADFRKRKSNMASPLLPLLFSFWLENEDVLGDTLSTFSFWKINRKILYHLPTRYPGK